MLFLKTIIFMSLALCYYVQNFNMAKALKATYLELGSKKKKAKELDSLVDHQKMQPKGEKMVVGS